MIRFIVATLAEAKPIIDIFDLKKNHNCQKFSVYNSSGITLTISKIGKINSALAVAYTLYKIHSTKTDIWINFGLSGNKAQKIGQLFLINKLCDYSSNKVYYPFLTDFKINTLSCITLDKKKLNYQKSLYDMEATGFFVSATKFSSKEFVYILKLVSDNENESIDFTSKKEIYDLIMKQKSLLKQFCKHLKNLNERSFNCDHEAFIKESERVFKKLNFTKTEKVQMKSLLRLYFLKKKNFEDNLIDINKSVKYNIGKFKKHLSL